MTTSPIIAAVVPALAMTAALLSACATPINPDDLQVPKEMTCVYLKEPLEITGLYGPFDVQWTTKLERGAYWSERTDGRGTYYRAPPAGISVVGKNGEPFPGQPSPMDGGFYVPSNANEAVTLYKYFSTAAAPAASGSTSDADCSTVGYTKDPTTSKVSLVAFASGGAVGGAAGGLIARSIGSQSMSYGQSAGVGAAGGLIGGLVVAAIINSEVGSISTVQPPVKDGPYFEKLRALSSGKVAIREVQVIATGNQAAPK